MSTERDTRAEGDDPAKRGNIRKPDDADQGPILVAIALLIFIGLIIGLFFTSIYGAETMATEAPVSAATHVIRPPW